MIVLVVVLLIALGWFVCFVTEKTSKVLIKKIEPEDWRGHAWAVVAICVGLFLWFLVGLGAASLTMSLR